jgi:phosphate transport system protein
MEGLTKNVMEMVHTSVQAVRAHDVELAKSLEKTEEEVDTAFLTYISLIADAVFITKDIITNLFVVRYLERIADHATYIGESITYIVTGEKISLR